MITILTQLCRRPSSSKAEIIYASNICLRYNNSGAWPACGRSAFSATITDIHGESHHESLHRPNDVTLQVGSRLSGKMKGKVLSAATVYVGLAALAVVRTAGTHLTGSGYGASRAPELLLLLLLLWHALHLVVIALFHPCSILYCTKISKMLSTIR